MWEMLYEAVYWPPGEGRKPPREEIFAVPEMSRYLEGWGRRGDAGFIALGSSVGGSAEERIGAAWHRQTTRDEPGYGFVDEGTPEIAVAVRREHRGRGVGGELMGALIEAARSSGYPALSLSVDRTNPAKRLYERLGFATVRSGSTDVLMKLDLA